MLFINRGRASGKTSDAIKMAAATGIPILVKDRNRASCAKQLAEKLVPGQFVNIITVDEFFRPREGRREYRKEVIIDDLEAVLYGAFNAIVVAATLTNARNISIEDEEETPTYEAVLHREFMQRTEEELKKAMFNVGEIKTNQTTGAIENRKYFFNEDYALCTRCLGSGKQKEMQLGATAQGCSVRMSDTDRTCEKCGGTGRIKK